MQIAAADPKVVSREELTSDIIESEKEVYLALARKEGKPDKVAEKIVIGRLESFTRGLPDGAALRQGQRSDHFGFADGNNRQTGRKYPDSPVCAIPPGRVTDGDAPLFKRIVIKLSGESLTGRGKFGIDIEILAGLCRQMKQLHHAGVEIGLVIGGGNIFRGLKASQGGMDRVTGDHMGMLATVINSMAFQDTLEKLDVDCRVMSAVRMDDVAEPYIRRRAVHHLKKGG